MGVIGIVAALTLPNLNSSTGEKEKVVKLKKIYSNMEDAMGRMEAVYGLDSSMSSKSKFIDRLADFVKGSSVKSSNSISSSTNTLCNSGCPYITLSDGTDITVTNSSNSPTFVGVYYVDLDGFNKGAGTFGKDIFGFYWDNTSSRFLPGGYDSSVSSNSYLSCFTNGNCAAWVINNENMDYLNASSTGGCKNSSIILDTTNTSCK